MKLLTKEILKKTPKLYATEKVADPIVRAKFFAPWSNWTWYMTEYDPKEKRAFGWVVGHEKEIGYFSLAELESVKGPMGLRIERDMYFRPVPLSKVKAEHGERTSPKITITKATTTSKQKKRQRGPSLKTPRPKTPKPKKLGPALMLPTGRLIRQRRGSILKG